MRQPLRDPGFQRKQKRTDSTSRFEISFITLSESSGTRATSQPTTFPSVENSNSYRQTSSHRTDREAHQDAISYSGQIEPWPRRTATGSCPRCVKIASLPSWLAAATNFFSQKSSHCSQRGRLLLVVMAQGKVPELARRSLQQQKRRTPPPHSTAQAKQSTAQPAEAKRSKAKQSQPPTAEPLHFNSQKRKEENSALLAGLPALLCSTQLSSHCTAQLLQEQTVLCCAAPCTNTTSYNGKKKKKRTSSTAAQHQGAAAPTATLQPLQVDFSSPHMGLHAKKHLDRITSRLPEMYGTEKSHPVCFKWEPKKL